ncbi:MAG: hypothetical protein ACTHU0_32285 [Kofleriaceae bacterium]
MRTSWLLLSLALAACDKGGASDPARTDQGAAAAMAAGGTGARETLVGLWKKGGLVPSPLTSATVDFGKDCQSGTINNVDVLVCVYGSPDEAKAAVEPGLGWVGEATGAAESRGALLIAVADRRKADPSGRTINQLMKLAPK